MNMYTIFDATTQKYFGRIFLFLNDAHAMRVFGDAITNKDDPMSEHPDDYTLYHIGHYDDDTGIPEGHDVIRVQTGLEAVKARQRKIEKTEALQREIAKLNGVEEHAE